MVSGNFSIQRANFLLFTMIVAILVLCLSWYTPDIKWSAQPPSSIRLAVCI